MRKREEKMMIPKSRGQNDERRKRESELCEEEKPGKSKGREEERERQVKSECLALDAAFFLRSFSITNLETGFP